MKDKQSTLKEIAKKFDNIVNEELYSKTVYSYSNIENFSLFLSRIYDVMSDTAKHTGGMVSPDDIATIVKPYWANIMEMSEPSYLQPFLMADWLSEESPANSTLLNPLALRFTKDFVREFKKKHGDPFNHLDDYFYFQKMNHVDSALNMVYLGYASQDSTPKKTYLMRASAIMTGALPIEKYEKHAKSKILQQGGWYPKYPSGETNFLSFYKNAAQAIANQISLESPFTVETMTLFDERAVMQNAMITAYVKRLLSSPKEDKQQQERAATWLSTVLQRQNSQQQAECLIHLLKACTPLLNKGKDKQTLPREGCMPAFLTTNVIPEALHQLEVNLGREAVASLKVAFDCKSIDLLTGFLDDNSNEAVSIPFFKGLLKLTGLESRELYDSLPTGSHRIIAMALSSVESDEVKRNIASDVEHVTPHTTKSKITPFSL